MTRRIVLQFLLFSFLLALPGAVPAKTFLFAHMLEQSGKITTATFTWDTFLYGVYTGGLPGSPPAGTGATVHLYLYNDDGTPMQSMTASNICYPCDFPMDTNSPHLDILVDDLVTAAGGFPGPVLTGFAVATVDGADAEQVHITSTVVNVKTGPLDVTAFPYEPPTIDSLATAAKTFVFPHLLEQAGGILDATNTFDTQIYVTYAGGKTGGPSPGGSVQVDLYLFDTATGDVMKSNSNTDVCNPCTFVLDDTSPKASPLIDDLIVAAGGFASPVQNACALLVATGNTGGLAIEALTIHIKSGPNDIEVFHSDPFEIGNSGPSTARSRPAPFDAGLRNAPNPFNPYTKVSYSVETAGPVRLQIIDVGGRVVATLVDGRQTVGPHEVEWDGTNRDGRRVASGTYFARMTSRTGERTLKMVLIK